MKSLPDQSILAEYLDYDPSTGVLLWRSRAPSTFDGGSQTPEHSCKRWNARFAGREAFAYTNTRGYRVGDLLGSKWYAHRIIYKLYFGTEPKLIDHINGNKLDNRASNLRSVGNAESARNMPLKSTNTSGHAGVYFDARRGKWSARIFYNKKQYSLGYHQTFELALAARMRAEKDFGYHPNHCRPLAA